MKRRDIYVWALAETLLIFALSLAVGAVITLLFGSCTRKVYVPTETVRTEYKDRVVEAVRVDTAIMRDSVAVYVNGDTVRITKYRDRWRTRIIERHDTVNVAKVDSVAVPVEVPKPYPVERKLTRWERTKMDAGGIAIGILGVAALCGLAWLAWLAYKKRRR